MKQRNSLILAVAFAFVFPVMSSVVSSEISDSVLTESHMKPLVVSNPDSLLVLLDVAEARKLSSFPSYRIDLLRAQAYNELRMFLEKKRWALKALESDSIVSYPRLQLQAMMIVASADEFYGNYEESISMALEAVGLARKYRIKSAEYHLLGTVSSVAFKMGDRKQGYDYLNQVIDEGISSFDVRELANVSSALGTKVNALFTDNLYNKAIDECQRRLEVIARIDRLGGAPHGFTDQQRAYVYARMASAAQRLHQETKAYRAYIDFLNTDYGSTANGRIFIVDYLLESGRYQTVLDFTRPLYKTFVRTDTINTDFHSLLYCEAKAYGGLGNYQKGMSLIERAAVIQDSLYFREKESKAQELSMMFSVNEKDLGLIRAKAELQRRRRLWLSSVAVGMMIMIVSLVLILYYRNMWRRTRIMVAQIDELLALRESMRLSLGEAGDEGYGEFIGMEKRIKEENFFLRSGFNRTMISQLTGLSSSRVAELIERYAQCSPIDYVNKLKVEYSIKLIHDHPNWTIDAIADASGFGSRNTYYHHFKRIYGITPAQYRKRSLEMKEKSGI